MVNVKDIAQIYLIQNNNAESYSGHTWIETAMGAFASEEDAKATLRQHWIRHGAAINDQVMMYHYSIIPVPMKGCDHGCETTGSEASDRVHVE